MEWVALLGLLGCGVVEGAPPRVGTSPVVAPDTVAVGVDTVVASRDELRAEDDAPVQERWGAPFAVSSRGRTAPRGERVVVVLPDSGATRLPVPIEPPPSTAPGTVARTPAPAAKTGATTSTPPPAGATRAPAPKGAPAERPTATRPVTATRTHRVEWGETWYAIARQYGVAPRELAAANPDIDPGRLVTGQVLRIPASPVRRPASRTHTVDQGESLWGIARRYGVSTDALRKANGMKDDRVRIGEKLVIPGGN